MELGRRRLVVLANSFKHGGRCIAGIDVESQEWIRPVSQSETGELSIHRTSITVDGTCRQLRPMDVIEAEFGECRASPHHPEDVEWIGVDAEYVGQGSVERLLQVFPGFVEPGPELLGNRRTRLVKSDFSKIGHHSLALVLVAQPRFELRAKSVRCRFDLSGCPYELAVTDAEFCERWKAAPFEMSEVLLTISLATPWEAPDGVMSCYKLVAGVIAIDGP